MPDWCKKAAIEITKHSQFYCLGDIEKIAQIIREEYENRPQELPAIPKGCVPSGPEGAGLTFENTGVPGSFSDLQMMDQQAAGRQARETGLGSQCLGPGINAHALGYGMNMPLPGRNLGDGQ